jgi:AraC-like DNA-binding protein
VKVMQGEVSTLHFSTDRFPANERAGIVREVYGRHLLRLDIEPLTDAPFRYDMIVRLLPGLDIMSAVHSPFRMRRTLDLVSDGKDTLTLLMSAVPTVASQLGREVTVAAGDAIVLSGGDVASYTLPAEAELFAVCVPRATLAPLLRDPDTVLVRPLPQGIPALRLLKTYCACLRDLDAPQPEFRRLATTHVHDLLVMALGATRDAAHVATGRGVRSARLQVVLAEINARYTAPAFSPEDVARALGLTPRYVQDLLHETGATFTERVLELRLLKARAMLADPECALKIIEIAYKCGFRDISHFNHCFRRCFGGAPRTFRGTSHVDPQSADTGDTRTRTENKKSEDPPGG